MMRLLVLLMSTLLCANGQLIYPDQLESLLNLESSGPNEPVHSAISANSFGNHRLGDETFRPAAAVAASASPSHNRQTYNREPSDIEAEYWENHVNEILARGIGKFAIDMDRAIYRSLGNTRSGLKPNVVFSPLSVVSTLAMVLLGSAGVTFDQVSKILGLESGVDISSHSEIVHLMLGHVLKSIVSKSSSNGPKITMANGIFVQNGYPIRDEFKMISRKAYDNEVINLDFIGKPDLAKETINNWVKMRTMGKITGILEQPVDRDTKVVMASALYFKGEWMQYFVSKITARKPFIVTPGRTVMVDMMFNGGEFPFYEDRQLGVKILGLPYKGYQNVTNGNSEPKPEAMMYVLLPTAQDADALRRLESRLNIRNLDALIGNMKIGMCSIAIPRMKLSSTLNLNGALSSLGLDSLFDSRASNLALLSPGLNATTGESNGIFTRMGGDEDEDKTGRNADPTIPDSETVTKANSFSYVDRKGGFFVRQWNSGVHIKKIRKSDHRRRSISENPDDNETKRRGKSTRNRRRNDDVSKSFEADGDNHRDVRNVRSKRQSRPIDRDFVRFIERRNEYPNYGLDSLRNSANLVNPGLFASDVLHKVEMDVTETGTEAAATTSIVLQRGGDIKLFNANRPFLFFIRHESTRLMLFWGTVNTPTPNY